MEQAADEAKRNALKQLEELELQNNQESIEPPEQLEPLESIVPVETPSSIMESMLGH